MIDEKLGVATEPSPERLQ